MGRISLIRQLAYGVHTANVAHVAIEITSHIDHDALAGLYQRTVGTTGQRGVKSGTSQSEIVGRRSRRIVACQQASHEYLHALSEHPEDAQTTLQAHQPLHFNGKLEIGHAGPVDRRNLCVSLGMRHARPTEELNLHLRLGAARLANEIRTARHHFRLGETGRQAIVFVKGQLASLEHQFLRQRQATCLNQFRQLFGLSDGHDVFAFNGVGALHEQTGKIVQRQIQIAADYPSVGINQVDIASNEGGINPLLCHQYAYFITSLFQFRK